MRPSLGFSEGSRLNRHARLRRRLAPYLMFLPAGALLLLLNFLPSAYGAFLSFLDFNYFRLERQFQFIGLAHYVAVFQDRVFWIAAKNTLIWVAGVVPGSFIVGLYFALLLNGEIRGKTVFRTVLLFPWVTPLVVVAILWKFALSADVGMLADVLGRMGRIDLRYVNWLGDPNLALPIVMAAQVWSLSPFFAVALLAGLQAIPLDMYSAAEIDGAGNIARFRYVTLPMLKPVTTVVLLQGLMITAYNFTMVYVMTNGGPVHASEVLTTYLWYTSFPEGQVGHAAAAGTLMIVALSVIGVVWVLKLLQRGVGE